MIFRNMALGVALVFGTGAAAASDAPVYPVAFELSYDGRVLGTPAITMREGQPVTMRVDRAGGYALRAVLTPQARGDVAMTAIALELDVERSGDWVRVSAPTIALVPGNFGTIEYGGTADRLPVRMKVTVGVPVVAGGS